MNFILKQLIIAHYNVDGGIYWFIGMQVVHNKVASWVYMIIQEKLETPCSTL